MNVEKKTKKGATYKHSGTLRLQTCSVEMQPSFVDFVHAGFVPRLDFRVVTLFALHTFLSETDRVARQTEIDMVMLANCAFDCSTQLSCTIAIDFTASNGAPTQPNSLHFHMPPTQPSLYARALCSVGEVIQDYDRLTLLPTLFDHSVDKLQNSTSVHNVCSDKLFPVLGFGARLPPNGTVSHNFSVNGNPSNPYCNGIPGVLAAYEAALGNVQLYGPTNFAPIISYVASLAAQKRDGSEYFILLLLTDGIITDMTATKNAIVAASTLPLSIIIVGIGPAEFDAMNELDGDAVRITDSRGIAAQRDIVQFVPFRSVCQLILPSCSCVITAF